MDDLPPELYSHLQHALPKVDRAATLLALGLTCRRVSSIVIPDLLYRDVHLSEAAQVQLELLADNAEIEGNDENVPLSHHVHHLCLVENTYELSKGAASLNRLIRGNALPNLRSLTLSGCWGIIDASLGQSCPRLRSLDLLEFQGDFTSALEGIAWEKLSSLRVPPSIDAPIAPSISNLATTLVRIPAATYPNLHTLSLVPWSVPEKRVFLQLLRANPTIEYLEFDEGNGQLDGFQSDMLPNLKVLKCNFSAARTILPHVHHQLVRLTLLGTKNAQAPYLLRMIPPNGSMPGLRSLGIQLDSSAHAKIVTLEGNRWREEDGVPVAEASKKKAMRHFDGNYLASIALACPNLEELELSGFSQDSIENLTAPLARLPKLETLGISGPINGSNKSFFPASCLWKEYAAWDGKPEIPMMYEPASFGEAAKALANGIKSLKSIRVGSVIGEMYDGDSLGARIVDGEVVCVRMSWGRIIGREYDW